MSQQINLYNPIFRPKKASVFSANGILAAVGITAALCAFAAAYTDNESRSMEARAREADAAQKDAAALYEETSKASAKIEPNKQMEADLAALESQLKARRDIVVALNSGVLGNSAGFSEYMQAFSRQSVNGLWLTGFDITGGELALQGRAVSADLVATYLKQLNREKLLQGRPFATLRVSQPSRDAGGQVSTGFTSNNSKADPKAQRPAQLRYLDFTISTLEASARSNPNAPLLGNVDASPAVVQGRAGDKQAAP